ncbi:MAG: CYTH domain-containing protein [Candidatus Moranbacteria bacterium]|nr:CYTH domain-containing protein [Candidatus Moranbacteria bacterium]
MTKNIEIEFKTIVTKEQYENILNQFGLRDNIFKQINYYFDTDDYALNQNQIVLRIRKKHDHYYKVTLKSQSEKGAYENHVLLSKAQAEDMIEHGFHTKDFFEPLDYHVMFKVSLDNYRVSTPYQDGVLFLDCCHYCNTIDYEIEYEVNDYDQGYQVFQSFLKDHSIEYRPTKRKSERAFMCKR